MVGGPGHRVARSHDISVSSCDCLPGFDTVKVLSAKTYRLNAESKRPYAEKNQRQNGVDVYCFRLEVINKGETEARDVQVYLADLKYKNATNQYVRVDKFSPMRIVWAHYRTRTLDVLLPGMPWFCDFFHISDPAKKALTHEHSPGAGSNDPVLALDLVSE